MDADRFDRLTRSLTSRLTRRRGLGLLGAVGLGSLVAPAHVDAKKKKKKKKKPQPACKVSKSATATTTTLNVSHKDLSLTTTERLPQNAGEALTSATIVRHKRALLLETRLSIGDGGRIEVVLVYGSAFTGIKRAELSTNGTTVTGTVDGRAIVPFSASAEPAPFQFQDGQPAPNMSLSDDLTQQLAQLYARAEAQAEQCAESTAERRSGVGVERHDSLRCLGCHATCAGAFLYCGSKIKGACAAAAAACLIGAPACFAACAVLGGAACVAAALTCSHLCAESGLCCAVPCGSTESTVTCCEEGETCLRPGACCRAGQTPCHGQNCCPSADRCLPGGACCLHPNFPCGQNCCGPFSGICCNGVCCNGECVNNTCCLPPSQRCGNTCCATTCCNNVCCPAGQACHPTTRQCAVLCAANEEYCPALGRCCGVGRTCCQKGNDWFCDLRACAPS